MKKQYRDQGLLSVFFTPPVIFLSLLIVAFLLYFQSFSHYFVGDDFTWLRWASDCQKDACQPIFQLVWNYFTDANGFFYRPGTKLYFYFLYHLFSYNPVAYHVSSLVVHVLNSFMIFLLALKTLRSRISAGVTAFLFLILNVHSETVYWIASINHLAASFFVLLGLLMFILWRETNKRVFFVLSFFSVLCAPLFHELGILAPLLIIGYDLVLHGVQIKKKGFPWFYFIYAMQMPLYLFFRYISQSHWLSGDYNYSLKNLPFNLFGNCLGYIGLILGGSRFLPLYEALRLTAREHIALTFLLIVVAFGMVVSLILAIRGRLNLKSAQKYILAFVLFIIPLLPFLALGNITYRYTYLASFGLLIFLAQFAASLLHFVPKQYHMMGVVVLSLLALTFSYYNIYELERLAGDWQTAGTITKGFVTAVNKEKHHNSTVYVANLPIRYHEAWVFPVGIEDAYWLGSKNNTEIVPVSKVDADTMKKSSQNTEIFIFAEME